MAIYASVANGNFSTGANWALCNSAASNILDSDSFSTSTTTSFVNSTSFTLPAITMDGFFLWILSTTGAGTITVQLAQSGTLVAGTATTVNTNTLKSQAWAFLPISATAISAGANYTIQFKTSTGATVSIYAVSAGSPDIGRSIRTTSTGTAPTTGDVAIVAGIPGSSPTTRTITYERTSTGVIDKIIIGQHGTLTLASTASTAFKMYLNRNFEGGNTGIFTTASQDATSTLDIKFPNIVTPNGVKRNVRTGHVFNMQPPTLPTYSRTKLGAALSSSAVSATTAVSTGWAIGDTVAFSSTSRVANPSLEIETRALTSSSGATIGWSSGLTYARDYILSGKYTGYAVKLNQQNSISGTDSTNTVQLFTASGGSSTIKGCVLQYASISSQPGATGTEVLNHVVIRDNAGSVFQVFTQTAGGTYNFNNLTVYSCFGNTFSPSQGTANNVTFIGCSSGVNCSPGVSVQNLLVTSSSAGGLQISSPSLPSTWNMAGLEVACCTGGFNSTGSSFASMANTGTWTVWRNSGGASANNGYGINCSYRNLNFTDINLMGNNQVNIAFGTASDVLFSGLTIDVDPTYSTADNFRIGANISKVIMESPVLGAATTSDFILFAANANLSIDLTLRNPTLSSPNFFNPASNTTLMSRNSGVNVQRSNGSTTTNQVYRDGGVCSMTVSGGSNFVTMTPQSATITLQSVYYQIPVASGKTAAGYFQITQSSLFNGTTKLYLRQNYAAGVTADTLVATASSGTALQTLVFASPSPTDNIVFEYYISVTGTAGFVTVGTTYLRVS